MSQEIADRDIVHSASPLETRYLGVHPRLYARAQDLPALREAITREPGAGLFRRVLRVAQGAMGTGVPATGAGDDLRGVGCGLAHIAIAARLAGREDLVRAGREQLLRMCQREDWTCSLQYGHWAHGVAVAYDWLYDDLDESLRRTIRETLVERTELVYGRWTQYTNAYPTSYAWNHSAVVHGGMMAAGCAIWGEIDGPGRWLRMGLEKLRLMIDALGPDGASAEGLAYGQYHLEFLLKSMIFAHELLGIDHFASCEFLKSYPLFMLYSALPRASWEPGANGQGWRSRVFVHLSDTDGLHWAGPDTQLRLVARRYRDGRAQWLANQAADAGVNGDASSFFNLFYNDASVVPVAPSDLPTLHHFRDKDLVILRSGWDDRASVGAIKCGPSSGYHAAARFRNNVAGGHMHPDAGHVVLHAHGQWLLVDDGYAKKFTSYQNTALINGIGQNGEGGDWFEDLEFRRGQPEGRIVHVRPAAAAGGAAGPGVDWVIADAAPPYKPQARLERFHRHLLYVRPEVWIVVDEFEAQAPSTFELRFHAPAPFVAGDGPGRWTMAAPGAALEVLTTGDEASPFVDVLRGISHYRDRKLDALAIRNAAPAAKALFITAFTARPAGESAKQRVTLAREGSVWRVGVEGPTGSVALTVHPGREDPRETITGL